MLQSYPLLARLLHWLTAFFILILFILGIWMTERSGANVWDALTNTLYAWHKFIGFTLLCLVILRFAVKLNSQRPAYPSSISPANIKLASAVHGILYLLLLIVPLMGWAGVTAYPALITVGGFELPAMPGIPTDEGLAKQLFQIHGYLALLLVGIASAHATAALTHLLIKKDGVFQRMWFKR
ncbi:cytochrome b [Polynucleobacter antarcticus]|uniref:Cytochrome B n=1 Tax=Polynucleobacter antarcticus TaxID=1743162 RepID=A0A6M9PWC4_9BURK|nr:cytochrome b/b6 domain-containing protein [Polynucleobacter antarcticus]QKM62176.1 cytochrome B [Polynucleobacter antarcticus]